VKIPLNRNLVAVIGGKGSGKTALLDLIANCYPDKIDSSNKNSFVNRIFNEGQDLLASINFLNQENFSKKLVESKFVTDSDIEYIPQGQIENKIGNTREFHNFLQNLIFKATR
jgi:predicted ATP-binding protein involved in virulence